MEAAKGLERVVSAWPAPPPHLACPTDCDLLSDSHMEDLYHLWHISIPFTLQPVDRPASAVHLIMDRTKGNKIALCCT